MLKEIGAQDVQRNLCEELKKRSSDAISTCKLSHYSCKDLHILTVRQTCLYSLRMHRKNDRSSHTHRLNYKQIYRLRNLNVFYVCVL